MTPKDFTEDQNPDYLLKLDSEGKVPEYVKKASFISDTETEDLHPYAFADTFNRAFPCHTKAATFMSAAYYAARHVNNPKIKQAIMKHAAAHNISEDIEAVFNAFEPAVEKQASSAPTMNAEDFALSISRDGNRNEYFFPVRTELEVLSSGDQLDRAYSSRCVPEPAMRKAAHVIVRRAADFGIPSSMLPGYIEMFGVERLPDMEGIAKVASSRSVNHDAYVQVISDLMESLTKAASVEDGIRIASDGVDTICLLDLANNVQYSPAVPHPQAAILGGPTVDEFYKVAASTLPIMGVTVPAEAVAAVPDRTIVTHFPGNIAAIVKEAKLCCEAAPDMASMDKAASLIGSLNPDTQRHLLSVLLQED